MKRKYTPNQAAADTRHEILRKMDDMEKTIIVDWAPEKAWKELRTYIKGMAKRASKKSGGLGRK